MSLHSLFCVSFKITVSFNNFCFNFNLFGVLCVCVVALARISLTLPKGTSSSELLSPDYPESFPDDDIMEWYFQVPDKHGVDVQFLNLTQPDCVKKEVAVEYHQKGRVTSVLGLNDTQPLQNQGDFLLTLRNCEMERAPADSPGLTFTLKVSASSPASTGLYHISTLWSIW